MTQAWIRYDEIKCCEIIIFGGLNITYCSMLKNIFKLFEIYSYYFYEYDTEYFKIK